MSSDVRTSIKEGIWSAHMGFFGRRCQIRINAMQKSLRRVVRPMGTASTKSTVPLRERQASSTTRLHIMNERKQDFFETQRELQCSYFRDYCSKHGRDS